MAILSELDKLMDGVTKTLPPDAQACFEAIGWRSTYIDQATTALKAASTCSIDEIFESMRQFGVDSIPIESQVKRIKRTHGDWDPETLYTAYAILDQELGNEIVSRLKTSCKFGAPPAAGAKKQTSVGAVKALASEAAPVSGPPTGAAAGKKPAPVAARA